VLSNHNLGYIKFQSPDSNLLAWLKQECVFIESDNLGVDRPVTVGYFVKILPELTNLTNFCNHLTNQLMMININVETTVELALHLKDVQLDAMLNGNKYVPILPEFEIYKKRLSYGHASLQTKTEVLGIKSTPKDAKLLGEFFTCLASETSTNHRDGTFLPKGAVHLLGPQTYKQVLKDNNIFLSQVVTIPVNLEYGTWFAIIDPNVTSDTEPISLNEHLLRKPWFL